MIPLKATGVAIGIEETVIGRVAPHPLTPNDRLVIEAKAIHGPRHSDDIALLSTAGQAAPSVSAIGTLDHLVTGDLVAIQPSGRIDTVFRIDSPNNGLFVTERCNSRCLMCSQPPRDVDDVDYFFALNSTLVSMLPKWLPTLGITGGEPTLLGPLLTELVRLIGCELPETQLEILSNGRAFSRAAFARAFAAVVTERTLLTIPLYSSFGPQHDYIVQARDAFTQTVLGLHNLATFGVRSEIRVVLHRQSYTRLPALARFIQKNLPFVEHVAFMGMEHTGYARLHDDILWIDPPEYSHQLSAAVEYLNGFGYAVSLYNLQPCLVPETLRPFLSSSISDWKREYLPQCDQCAARPQCGGVFGTSRRHSHLIRPIANA